MKSSAKEVEVWIGGAAESIGRSCFLARIGPTPFLLDFGYGAGCQHSNAPTPPICNKNWPQDIKLSDVSFLAISHFHADHVAALPALFAQGFTGPVFVSLPTAAALDAIINDVQADQRGDAGLVSLRSRCRVVPPLSTVVVGPYHLEFTPAGHLLGACMISVTNAQTGTRLVYTGDFSDPGDSHVPSPAAPAPASLLICEATTVTTARAPEAIGVTALLKQVAATVKAGGKVLIPAGSLGRAPELCLLLDRLWHANPVLAQVPMFYTRGVLEDVLQAYKACRSWARSSVTLETSTQDPCLRPYSPFCLSHFAPYSPEVASVSGPAVLLACPGALTGGVSLAVFTAWCSDPANLVLFAGLPSGPSRDVCLGQVSSVSVDGAPPAPVRCRIAHINFGGHADLRATSAVIARVTPQRLLAVHGSQQRTRALARAVVGGVSLAGEWAGVKTTYETRNIVNVSTKLPVSESVTLDSLFDGLWACGVRCRRQGQRVLAHRLSLHLDGGFVVLEGAAPQKLVAKITDSVLPIIN